MTAGNTRLLKESSNLKSRQHRFLGRFLADFFVSSVCHCNWQHTSYTTCWIRCFFGAQNKARISCCIGFFYSGTEAANNVTGDSNNPTTSEASFPFPPVDTIWSMMIVWRMERENYQNCFLLCCVWQLCAIVHKHTHAHTHTHTSEREVLRGKCWLRFRYNCCAVV